ncbi:MAG: hypothetical protein ACK54V_00315 [Candidatus Kapaibacterium sp.]
MAYLQKILSGICGAYVVAAMLLVMTSSSLHAAFEGRMRVTIRDTVRAKNIPATIIYASDLESGDNKPLVGTSTNTIPVFSVVVMGHGFQLPVTVYRSWASNICRTSPSTIVILPETGGELFPNHADFALDMVECLNYMQREGSRAGSIWNGHIRNDIIIAGHSMGGGCAMLAAKEVAQTREINLRGVIAMAPAETNPSSTAAAASVTAPTLILAGSQDCVTPLQSMVQPIYNAVASACKVLAVLPGASHCQFADTSFVCSLGEFNCRATVSRVAQQSLTHRYVSLFVLRKDSVARAIDNTQIQTTMSFFSGSELPSDTTRACQGDTITLRCTVPNSHLLWLPDSLRGQEIRMPVRRGTTTVTLVSTQCFGQTRLTHVVQSIAPPAITMQGSTSLCRGDSVILRAKSSEGSTLRWSTGETSDSIVVRTPGVYSASASSSCGTATDSLRVQYSSITPIPLQRSGDTLFCDGIGLVSISCAFDTTRFGSIKWNTGESASTLLLKRSGTFTLFGELQPRAGLGCVGYTDTLRITIRDVLPPEPTITRRADTLWSSIADSYTWLKNGVILPGRTDRWCAVTETGDYRVRTRSALYHDCPALSAAFSVTEIVSVEHSEWPAEPVLSVVYNRRDQELLIRDTHHAGRVQLLNLLGNVVRDINADAAAVRVDVSDVPPGLYLVVRKNAAPVTVLVH